jgi:hypothetical protein
VAKELANIRKEEQQLTATVDAYKTLCKHVSAYESQLIRTTNFYRTALPEMGRQAHIRVAEHRESLQEFLEAARCHGSLVQPSSCPNENKVLIASLQEELVGLEKHAIELAKTQLLLQVCPFQLLQHMLAPFPGPPLLMERMVLALIMKLAVWPPGNVCEP